MQRSNRRNTAASAGSPIDALRSEFASLHATCRCNIFHSSPYPRAELVGWVKPCTCATQQLVARARFSIASRIHVPEARLRHGGNRSATKKPGIQRRISIARRIHGLVAQVGNRRRITIGHRIHAPVGTGQPKAQNKSGAAEPRPSETFVRLSPPRYRPLSPPIVPVGVAGYSGAWRGCDHAGGVPPTRLATEAPAKAAEAMAGW